MTKLLVDFDVPECIGCAACAAVLPEFWVMVQSGEKAHLIGSHEVEDHEHLEPKSEEDFKKIEETAESCPVNCIHMLRDGEKVI